MPRRTKPNDLNKPKPGAVDLGLSQLISALESSGGRPVEAPKEEPSAPLAPVICAGQEDEYGRLAKSRGWHELAALAELKLRDGVPKMEQAEARAWWVKSQFEMHAMPLAMLAGPLDNLAALLLAPGGDMDQERISRVRGLVLPLLGTVSAKLREAGELDLAIGLMERAFRVDGSGAGELLQAVAGRLAKGPPRPKDRHGSLQYQKLQALRSELEGMSRASYAVKAGNLRDAPREASKPPERSRRRAPAALLCAGALIALVILAMVLRREMWPAAGPAGSRYAPAALLGAAGENAPPEQFVPETERITRLSYLDAVLYDLKNSPRMPSLPPPRDRERPAVSEELKSSSAPRERKDKERVDTSSPVESAEMEARRRSQREGGLETETERRDGFTPFEMAQPPGSRDAGAEFRQFPKEREFTIIVRTRVMPKASVYGASLGELERGDRVAVIAQEGYWLKIRSKHGRVGFILAQDAVTEPP